MNEKTTWVEKQSNHHEALPMASNQNTRKICVDLTMLKNLYCGLGHVSLNMGKQLSKSVLASDVEFLVPKNYVGYFGHQVSYSVKSFWKRRSVAYDLVHLTHQLASNNFSKKPRMVCTIHDLNFIFEKKKYKHHKYMSIIKRNVRRADIVVYISNYVKNMVNEYLPEVAAKEQHVIYNGVEVDVDKQVDKPDFLPNGEFLFTIGEIKNKKNFHVLLDFLKALPEPINLVIAGKDSTPCANFLRKEIRSKGLQGFVILPGKISENDKIYCYRNCKAFVFPSLYEGFGLPVIEAMCFGKPVFTSTHTSLPEIGGNQAFYWENFDPHYMAKLYLDKLEQFYITDENSKRTKDYAMQFTWEYACSKYIELYQKLISP